MSNKRYKLKKDIVTMDLTAKAGEIGVRHWNEKSYDESSKVWFDNGRYYFYLSKIKEFPDWFEEEHECKYCGALTFQPDEECYKAPTQGVFTWTDELVLEYSDLKCKEFWSNHLYYQNKEFSKMLYTSISAFKASKTNTVDKIEEDARNKMNEINKEYSDKILEIKKQSLQTNTTGVKKCLMCNEAAYPMEKYCGFHRQPIYPTKQPYKERIEVKDIGFGSPMHIYVTFKEQSHCVNIDLDKVKSAIEKILNHE